jgi:hypothetical protein
MEGRARVESAAYGRGALVQPRVLVGLSLILAGVVWAIARGLAFYGLTPAHLGYDLDQPPVLLLIVGAWLIYRGRRR